MKRIILTETQYKSLIKKKLNEQEVVFNNPKDEFDVTNEMMQLLIHLKFYIDTIANKSLFIDKVENGIIYIDSTKYNKEEKDLINREIDRWISFTNTSGDKRNKDLTYDFGKDTDWDDLHPNEDIAVVDNDDNSATNNVDLEDNSVTTIEYDPNKKYSRSEYISLVKDIAISQMKKHKIPASITIAQAILESGDGNSGLARKGKNHFGIKCHSSWTGEKIYLDTREENNDGSSRTEKGACFRKYGDISLSFDDHSKFLTDNSRYDKLFDLDITDYKGWAEGLQKAGYATSSSYAKTLISIIEKNSLYKYDSRVSPVVDCDLTASEVKYFNDNIINNEDNLNFRYWVNLDPNRLNKVNKRLSDCGFRDPNLDKVGSKNDYLRNAFALIGKEWVNAGKPVRPEDSTSSEVDDDVIYSSDDLLTWSANAKKDRDKGIINPILISDIIKALKAINMRAEISWARTGHSKYTDKGNISRHWSGNAVDISRIEGEGNPEGRSSNKGIGSATFMKNGDRLVQQLEKMGYTFGESGKTKGYLWRTNIGGNHWNHVHVSNKSKKKVNDEEPKNSEKPEVVDAPSIVGNSSYILGKSIVVDKNGPKNHESRALGNWQSDNATDIFGTPGTTVYSITKGTVSKIGGNPEDHTGKIYGGSITIKGKDGYPDIFYTHLQKIKVVKGQEVTLGTPLAEISLWQTSPKGSHVHVGLPYGIKLNSILNLDTGKIK